MKIPRTDSGGRGKASAKARAGWSSACLRGCGGWEAWGPLPTRTPPAPSSLQEHQGPGLASSGSPKDSPAHEVISSSRGAYTRFDVPQPRVTRSWPSFRGGAGEGTGRAVLRALLLGPCPVGHAQARMPDP